MGSSYGIPPGLMFSFRLRHASDPFSGFLTSGFCVLDGSIDRGKRKKNTSQAIPPPVPSLQGGMPLLGDV